MAVAWVLSPVLVPFLAATAGLLVLAGYARRTSGTAGGRLVRWFVVLAVSAAGWGATYALRLASTTVEAKLLWLTAEYLFSPVVPVAWLLVTLAYTGNVWPSSRRVALLFVVPGSTLVLTVTNASHGLLWSDVGVAQVGSLLVLERTFGPWFYLNVGYGYLLGVAGVAVLARYVASGVDPFRPQALVLAGAVVAPLAANAGFVFGVGGAGAVEFTSAGFAVSAGLLFVGIRRYRLFDLVPVGRALALASVPDALFILDRAGRIVTTNPAADRLLGDVPPGTTLGRALPTLGAVLDDPAGAAAAVGVPTDGGERTFSVRAQRIERGRRGHLGWTVLAHDVTERHRREVALQRSNDRLESFASIVSHDLRNPLGIAMGYLDLGRDDPAALDGVETALHRIDAIIDDVLSVAREEGPVVHPIPIDLAALVREAWAGVETGGVALDVRVEGVTVEGDHDRLLRLFENLFRNAVEHGSPDETGGSQAHPNEDARGVSTVTVGTSGGGFFVADDGPGLPPGLAADVFELGLSTTGGTGFGLAIVRDVAVAHGWTVTAGAATGGGARFDVRVG